MEGGLPWCPLSSEDNLPAAALENTGRLEEEDGEGPQWLLETCFPISANPAPIVCTGVDYLQYRLWHRSYPLPPAETVTFELRALSGLFPYNQPMSRGKGSTLRG